jgi:GT2 family glycosyltransferase
VKLSVIIVNYNVRPFLESALVSVQKAMMGIEGEVIVVDNASDDGSAEMLRQRFPDVRLIVNERNLGFAAANNLALRDSSGNYVLLLNPDTLVQEDTLRVMADFLDNHPEVGLAGCKVLNSDGSFQLACRRSFPTPWVAFTKIAGLSSMFPRLPFFARYNLTYLDPESAYEVDAVSGSFMFVRRKAIETVGGLDEQFFMYGEDLDWCFRIKQEGWKIYYTPATQIIHYKGQSARRSDIDEVKLFYEAMHLFVKKHFKGGGLSPVILRAGIAVREWLAFLVRIARPLRAAILDLLCVNLALLLAEFIWFGEFFRLPAYAYPVETTVPWLIIAVVMYSMGAYTTRKLSISRAAASVFVGYVIISALTFFFKQYGFSRMVVLISGAISMIVLPGWRLAASALLRSPEHRRGSLFGRRTIIVGTEIPGQEVLRKLRARIDDGYDVVGFIDVNRRRVGEKLAGVEILGSIDNIGKVIQEQKASDVIFSTDNMTYSDILSVIGRARNKSVNFHLVPNSLEVIIGRTHIDQLDDIPLIEIEYNIDRSLNRFLKRCFDLAGSSLLLLFAYPWIAIGKRPEKETGRVRQQLLLLPRVLDGSMSLVGPPPFASGASRNGSPSTAVYLGKPGLTGLVQLNDRADLTSEESEKYNLYYAKNQSLLLDVEIILKTLLGKRKS